MVFSPGATGQALVRLPMTLRELLLSLHSYETNRFTERTLCLVAPVANGKNWPRKDCKGYASASGIYLLYGHRDAAFEQASVRSTKKGQGTLDQPCQGCDTVYSDCSFVPAAHLVAALSTEMQDQACGSFVDEHSKKLCYEMTGSGRLQQGRGCTERLRAFLRLCTELIATFWKQPV